MGPCVYTKFWNGTQESRLEENTQKQHKIRLNDVSISPDVKGVDSADSRNKVPTRSAKA